MEEQEKTANELMEELMQKNEKLISEKLSAFTPLTKQQIEQIVEKEVLTKSSTSLQKTKTKSDYEVFRDTLKKLHASPKEKK